MSINRQAYEPPNCGKTTPHDQHFHSPIGGLTLNCPGVAVSTAVVRSTEDGHGWVAVEQSIAWVDELAEHVLRGASSRLIREMLRRGEDVTNDELWRVRKAQLGWSLKAHADRGAKP